MAIDINVCLELWSENSLFHVGYAPSTEWYLIENLESESISRVK